MKLKLSEKKFNQHCTLIEKLCPDFLSRMSRTPLGERAKMGDVEVCNGFDPKSIYRHELTAKVEQNGRVNFYPGKLDLSTISEVLTSFKQLPQASHYAWAVVVRPLLHRTPLSLPQGLEVIKDPPSGNVTAEILELWNRDYAFVTSLYPSWFAKKDSDELRARISDGSNLIFRLEGTIVGHVCFKDVRHPVLGIPCVYWHQWVDQKQSSKIRAVIHSHCFWELDQTGLPTMSGVSLHNLNGMRHAIENGSVPILLCIRSV